MKILAIETSCDDTGITMLEIIGKDSFRILADELAMQSSLHSAYGGVYPNLAKNEHTKNLPILLERVLSKLTAVKIDKKKPVDLIAVTYGPGLEPCLWTGITFAQKLAKEWNVPIIPVNHMEGHIWGVFGKNKGSFKIPSVKFPVLSLLVSGGHTELVLSKSFLKHKVIGKTLDDAAGEAFDKVARMLGLPYPGGPEISRLAEKVKKSRFSLPRPMMKSKDFNFSFSGLKTAVLYTIRDLGKKLTLELTIELAHEFQNAVVDVLVHKTKKAIEANKIQTLIVGGGVSANKHLRRELKKIKNIELLLPTKELSRDNAIMIGMAGYLRYKNGEFAKRPQNIKAKGSLQLK